MFDALTEKVAGALKKMKGNGSLTEANISETVREIRLALLEADVALPVVKTFCEDLKAQALGKQVLLTLNPAQEFVGLANKALVSLLTQEAQSEFSYKHPAPVRIMLCGLQGVGKTTTCGKLAYSLSKRSGKKKVLLASCDVNRPAAMQQLEILSKSANVDYFKAPEGSSVGQIADLARQRSKAGHYDFVLLDTAGRTAADEALMDELKAVRGIFEPNETFLVLDSMAGQSALGVCETFSAAVSPTGLIFTKADGDSRAGAILSAKAKTGLPIRYLGVSEKIDGLDAFDPQRVAGRILGMGDVVGLVEKAYEARDEKEAERLEKKFKSGAKFDMDDFLSQLRQMKRMGGIGSFMGMLPNEFAKAAQNLPAGVADDKAFARMEGIILSMTPKERKDPEILKASRKKRIAAGAGVTAQEINQLIKQWEMISQMMKSLQKGGLSKLMKMAGMFGKKG